jgi:hypothetical protein
MLAVLFGMAANPNLRGVFELVLGSSRCIIFGALRWARTAFVCISFSSLKDPLWFKLRILLPLGIERLRDSGRIIMSTSSALAALLSSNGASSSFVC